MAVSGVLLNGNGTLDYTIVLIPRTTAGLSQNVTLVCDDNVTLFTTPVGL